MKTKNILHFLNRTLFKTAILLLLLPACELSDKAGKTSDDPYNGIRKGYRKDGTLLSAVSYKDSVRHGVAKNYYRDGTLKIKMTYDKGIKHGDAITYYEDGDVYQVTPFVNGKREGIQKRYYPGNKLMAEIPFKDNEQVPGLKEYNKDGRLITKEERIVFRLVDKTAFENRFELHMQLSDKARNAQFTREVIKENGEPDFTVGLISEGGTAMLEYYVRPGQSLMQKVHIIAKRKTRLGNTEVFRGQYNLAVENTKRFY
ncbi:MAG: toxin-antitoxin system YwqK family antitoxin [Bacteroidales bacterium]